MRSYGEGMQQGSTCRMLNPVGGGVLQLTPWWLMRRDNAMWGFGLQPSTRAKSGMSNNRQSQQVCRTPPAHWLFPILNAPTTFLSNGLAWWSCGSVARQAEWMWPGCAHPGTVLGIAGAAEARETRLMEALKRRLSTVSVFLPASVVLLARTSSSQLPLLLCICCFCAWIA